MLVCEEMASVCWCVKIWQVCVGVRRDEKCVLVCEEMASVYWCVKQMPVFVGV